MCVQRKGIRMRINERLFSSKEMAVKKKRLLFRELVVVDSLRNVIYTYGHMECFNWLKFCVSSLRSK